MEHIYKSVCVYVPVISCGMMDHELFKNAFGAIEINRVTKDGRKKNHTGIFSFPFQKKSSYELYAIVGNCLILLKIRGDEQQELNTF